jgi:hypothetical protein
MPPLIALRPLHVHRHARQQTWRQPQRRDLLTSTRQRRSLTGEVVDPCRRSARAPA